METFEELKSTILKWMKLSQEKQEHYTSQISNIADEQIPNISSQLADIATKKFTQKRSTKFNPIIVCYGDSNTRYYEGDRGVEGSISYAYSSWIDRFCLSNPAFYGANVINAGYSGQTSAYAVDNYATNITNNNANIAVIGFGTNDIKTLANTLETYISNMETVIDRLLTANIVPVVLGIPWFEFSYVNDQVLYDRLPVWNKALRDLCISKNVEFIDAFSMFLENEASIWFNESSTPKRHYSKIAQKVLAEEIFKRILYVSNVSSSMQFNQKLFNFNTIGWFDTYGTIEYIQYNNGLDSMDCLKIPSGQSITLKLTGRYSIGFYPRAVATARFSDAVGDVQITNTIDDGLYYPMKRIGGSSSSYIGITTTLTITAVGGDLFIREISSEAIPSGYNKIRKTALPSFSVTALPSSYEIGSKVYCFELTKEVTLFSNSPATWTDASGYICVGTTTDRTSVQANVPKGFKFYDITTATRYRWNGVDTWSTF